MKCVVQLRTVIFMGYNKFAMYFTIALTLKHLSTSDHYTDNQPLFLEHLLIPKYLNFKDGMVTRPGSSSCMVSMELWRKIQWQSTKCTF